MTTTLQTKHNYPNLYYLQEQQDIRPGRLNILLTYDFLQPLQSHMSSNAQTYFSSIPRHLLRSLFTYILISFLAALAGSSPPSPLIDSLRFFSSLFHRTCSLFSSDLLAFAIPSRSVAMEVFCSILGVMAGGSEWG